MSSAKGLGVPCSEVAGMVISSLMLTSTCARALTQSRIALRHLTKGCVEWLSTVACFLFCEDEIFQEIECQALVHLWWERISLKAYLLIAFQVSNTLEWASHACVTNEGFPAQRGGVPPSLLLIEPRPHQCRLWELCPSNCDDLLWNSSDTGAALSEDV
eukprot:6094409-Amphidinium_carterae.1